jgi:short-subunit dehydrogenase
VDIWVNNAGHGLSDSVEMMDRDDYRRMFDTNLFGAIEGMQAAILVMKQQGGGAIINISSVAGHIPLPYSAAYSASKFALNAIGKAARVELLGTGVHVMTVCPGYIGTNFDKNKTRGRDARRLNSDKQLVSSAETVARDTLNGYLKGKREIFTPRYYWFAAKLYQVFPGLVEWGMARKLKSSR